MANEAAEAIRSAIEERGPITFAEYMELALYGAGGFYERPPIGETGHFVTSPHAHPAFGELVARALRRARDLQGNPDPFRVVDVGAGDGTLAALLLRFLEDIPIEYIAVERSPGARERLRELPVRVLERIEDAGPIDGGCLIANELLDNLPFRKIRATDGGVAEVLIGLRSSGGLELAEVEVPCDEQLAARAPELEPGDEAAAPVGALAFIDDVARILRRGHAILIDYGFTGDEHRGDIHGYRGQRLIEDVLSEPGATDITAGVDFTGLATEALRAGLQPGAPVSQRDALLALGFADIPVVDGRTDPSALTALDALRTWSDRNLASLLVDPAGLGDFIWLTLSTPGLPELRFDQPPARR